MDRDDELWQPDEVRAAELLDAEISAALRGRPAPDSDPAVLWLATSLRPQPSRAARQRVAARLRAQEQRSWRVLQAAAAALAVLFALHALSGYFAGEWIARNLGETFSQHTSFEMGLAFLAAAAAVGAGAIRRRWAPVSVASGAPLGLLLAAHGAREITVFAWGAALHLAEGALAIVLLVTWWRISRYRRAARVEEEV